LADTHRAEAAASGERRKRFDLVSFMPRILRVERAATNRKMSP
jgi:16S rRNA U1498 N3-methylase RsmE